MPALRRISSELRLPEPIKARILLEMAGDLEALYEHYRSRGQDDDVAARLTEERLLASPDALQHLIVVHTTGYRRWLGRAAEGARRGFDLLLFGLGVVPTVTAAAWMVASRLGAVVAAPELWPLLAMGALVTALAAWKAYQLFLARGTTPAELHRGLSTLLVLALAGPLVGGVAFLVRLYELSLEVMHGRAGHDVMLGAAEGMQAGATVLGFGLLVGIGAGLVWFVLANRISAVEQAESAALLAA